ncbi:hypothetical protein [Pseudobacteriovorax antillogorgiicola]|uniref:Outer membrane protein beta-barrel domain-containing protein n=1 Tax=Pseudobacteriovorax antillogorgiicola TaxID=1513793 RepID=A0A1Y6CBG1_9BACT|nr:hypothetical protein [Pseudobacteriovorax antillogorgiicola]TCS48624.1 hypothetical protein EDD56_11746 [Pseudobacteriovorax antillogorgiicola]SMF55413.1 hypothetical protein SAMN06296036_117113 [Pseudobacteriovorax antillogorgiicola]
MGKTLLAFILSLSFGLPAEAQEIEDFSLDQPPSYSSEPKKTTRKKTYRKRSRQRRIHHISGHGILNYFGSGVGLGYEYRTNSFFSWGVSASYTQAHLEAAVGVGVNEILDATNTRASGFIKFFIWDLVYAGLKINGSQVSGDYSLDDENQTEQAADVPFTATEIHPDLFLGTHFDLKSNFFLAIDWVGFGVPVTSGLSTKSTESSDQAVEFLTQETPAERIRSEIDQQLGLHYVVVHFGYRL